MYFRVDVDSQTAKGRDVMQETVDWWSTQPEEIRNDALGDNDRISLDEMVKKLINGLLALMFFGAKVLYLITQYYKTFISN